MADHLGWDIGGAHLKLSRLTVGEGRSASIRTSIVPFELWKDPGALAGRLRSMLAASVPPGGGARIAAHGVTMTAELSDIFATRAEGVRSILQACREALRDVPLRVLDLHGEFALFERAMEEPQEVAAANWMATARLVGRLAADAIVIDVGSTTTDVIPVRAGRPCPSGRTDTERLMSGELLYAGLLRTPPSSLTDRVPLRGGWCRVAPEHFAVTADVYRILGRIDETEYTVPTPDGRGRSVGESAARLARLVCSDPETLGREAIEAIASYLESRQIDRTAEALLQVLSLRPGAAGLKAVVAGAGAFLGEEAAGRAGLRTVRLARLLPEIGENGWDRAAPSAAIALLLAEEAGAISCGERGAG